MGWKEDRSVLGAAAGAKEDTDRSAHVGSQKIAPGVGKSITSGPGCSSAIYEWCNFSKII